MKRTFRKIYAISQALAFLYRSVDASYEDPVGPQAERPKTAGLKRRDHDEGVDFDDEIIGDDLLPE